MKMGLLALHGAAIVQRSVSQDIANAPQTFSSFSKCMSKSYCKYPFIVGCVIGGIFVISLLWCLIRCCICGVNCCSCCCGGCGGRSKHKHSTAEVHHHYPPTPGSQAGGSTNTAGYQRSQPPAYEPPQYAYEVNKDGTVSEDALPHMPTWETTKVEVKDDVELGHVNNDAHRRGLDDAAASNLRTVLPFPGEKKGGIGSASPGRGQGHVHMPANNSGFNSRAPSPGPRPHLKEGYYGYPADHPAQRKPHQWYNRHSPQQAPVNPYQSQGYGSRETHDYPDFEKSETRYQTHVPQQEHNMYNYDASHMRRYAGQTQNQYDDPRQDPRPDQKGQQEWTVL